MKIIRDFIYKFRYLILAIFILVVFLIGGITPSTDSCTIDTYDTKVGQTASTTGNISGIYDMVGGISEFVMSNVADQDGNFNQEVLFFEEIPEQKYYNKYSYGTDSNDFSRAMLGDGLKDVAGFYRNNSIFPIGDYPFMVRGLDFTFIVNSGVFASTYVDLWINTAASRVVIQP